MAKVSKKEIPEVSSFMTEFWNLIKEYYIPELDNQTYWDEMIDACSKLADTYNEALCRELLIAYVKYLDKKSKTI